MSLLLVAAWAPLSFGQVLDGLDGHPALVAADAKVMAARAKMREADGAFDTYTTAEAKAYPTGKDQRALIGTFVEQPTRVWGANVRAGWRRGTGDVPPYEGDLKTVDNGELALQLRLPLLRGRATDPARTKRRAARLEGVEGEALRDDKRRQLSIKAAEAYWDWVAAGHAARAYDDLLEAAKVREAGMIARIEAGDIARIAGLEARRAVLKRAAQRIKAWRSVEKAAIKLGLYRRVDGRPAPPTTDELPDLPSPGALDGPMAARPAVDALRARGRQAELASALGENDALPQLDFEALAVQPLGDEKAEMAAGVKFSLPLQRRKATGAAARAAAEARLLNANARWVEERIDAVIADARSAARAAAAQVEAARAAADAADAVVVAQRESMANGDAEMLALNQREQAATEARVTWIEAKAAWHVAAAQLRFAGLD